MTKRLFVMIMSAMLLLTAFTGCGKDAPQPQQPANQETVQEETKAEAEETEKPASPFAELSVKDLDGNDVDSSIFAEHDLTIVNVWATFCNPCLREMPDLGKMNREYAESEKGVQIVGIIGDVTDMEGNADEAQLDFAKEIITKTEADYLHLIPDGNMMQFLVNNVPGFPTTFFVDSEGNLVGDAVVGARDESNWTKEIEKRLESMK